MVTFPLIAAIGQVIFQLLLSAMAVFLILLVLVQRGRGGGLAGALGGMGGSSAFGAKAGDVFTRVTIVAAAIWIILCMAATQIGPSSESLLDTGTVAPTTSSTLGEGPALTGPATEEEGAAGDATVGETDTEQTPGGETANDGSESDDEAQQ